MFFNTAVLAVLSTSFAVSMAVFFAYLTERTDMPFRNVAWGLMLILAIVFPTWGSRFHLAEISLAYPIYYVGLSLWLQRDSLRR